MERSSMMELQKRLSRNMDVKTLMKSSFIWQGAKMKWHRINALLMRHIYLNRKSFPRLMDMLFWPIMSLFLWGFVRLFLEKSNAGGLNIVTILLGAVLLWEILQEGQHSVSIAFLEDVWQKNLLNIFVTPLT